MVFVFVTWFVISAYISGTKRLMPIKTIYKITFYVYSYKLQAAGVESFILEYQ